MMGRLNHGQEHFFYSFNLDEAVPDDHLVRQISAVLDLSWVHSELAPYYPRLGRPSIDPVLMIRMLIVGYAFAIRSERALCREVQVNLAYRWFCGLSIEDKIPDHSAFSRARSERFRESAMFRRVFAVNDITQRTSNQLKVRRSILVDSVFWHSTLSMHLQGCLWDASQIMAMHLINLARERRLRSGRSGFVGPINQYAGRVSWSLVARCGKLRERCLGDHSA
jgi:transposase